MSLDDVSLKRTSEPRDVIYAVTETYNLDDYKRRGSPWTSASTSLFSKMSYAFSYIVRTKRALLKKWVRDMWPKDRINEFGEEDPDIDAMEESTMEDHFDNHNKGEHVSVQYSFEISEEAIDAGITDEEQATKRRKNKK